MAKDAHDRDDLLREASALPRRIELKLNGVEQNVFCGFRDGGAFSLYWTPDDVFQFNAAYELRRAFWRDRIVASYKHQLHWLDASDSGRVRLTRRAFSDVESDELIAFVTAALQRLTDLLDTNGYQLLGEVPDKGEGVSEVTEWIRNHGKEVRIALHPGVG